MTSASYSLHLSWRTILKHYFSFMLCSCVSAKIFDQNETMHRNYTLTHSFYKVGKLQRLFFCSALLIKKRFFLIFFLRLQVRPHHYYWRVAVRPRRARWDAAAKWPWRPRQGGALPSLRQGQSKWSSDLTHVEPLKEQWESFWCVHLFFCECLWL